MPVTGRKYLEALDLAMDIIIACHSDETDVTEVDVRDDWSAYDLYEWLEAWDYEWTGEEWDYVGFDD